LELAVNHPFSEGVHSLGYGTENVYPEIPHVENLQVQQMESWDVESHHVDYKDLETVDVVYLVTGIAVAAPENVVLAILDANQVTGSLGPALDWKRSFTCGF